MRGYLERHPFLAPLVEEAHAAIIGAFGAVQRVDLTVVVDPEDGSEDLFALVHTPLPPAAAWATLDRFDRT